MVKRFERVIEYHEITKHHPQRYARSSGIMDWSNEPAPFRSYKGASLVKLPRLETDPAGSHMELYTRPDTEAAPLILENLASFLELSMGLSAWKSFSGTTWPLRMNPSSGNLHPTEMQLVLPKLDKEIDGGVYHYAPYFHSLEERAVTGSDLEGELRRNLGEGAFIAALTSIYWRETWKYGERSFRYINLNGGHAMAAMAFSAALLGWRVSYLGELPHKDAERLLGLDIVEWRENEAEELESVFLVHPAGDSAMPGGLTDEIIEGFASLDFTGEPDMLSKTHYPWPAIDEVSSDTVNDEPCDATSPCAERPFLNGPALAPPGASLIRNRRSAQAYDGESSITLDTLLSILDKTLPRSNAAPFDIEIGKTSINLLLFIHRVEGLESGLYFYLRNDDDLHDLKAATRDEFSWEQIGSAPLYLLARGDVREESRFMSCNQDIASDGAFSLAMIASFAKLIEDRPHEYRRLHWEAGIIGQVLYLEALASGLGGTGIGCFLDDLVHDMLGLRDNTFQDLYHFTIGGPVIDTRLTTLPPYQHLEGDPAIDQS